MRINNLGIQNLRAISWLELTDLDQMVLIAGPNGCGKSCIFDGIRLLKSCYGGYQPNEWQQWFGEFQINVGRQDVDLRRLLFRDRSKPVVVEATFVLSDRERTFLQERLHDISTEIAWQIVAPHTQGYGVRPVARDLRTYSPQVAARAQEIRDAASSELTKAEHAARIEISTENNITPTNNPLLEVIFATFDPQNLGIIDYHSANRAYGREQVGGINLNLDSGKEQKRQHALYNTPNKYTNIKSEMASSYVRDLISRERGIQKTAKASLTETLQELFQAFFPDKKFEGPKPTDDGGIEFTVTTTDGISHDINDLSSGEKEVLFGYLRLRNASPRDSVILLDEPEIHLNPALIKGLPQFYRKHIGQALGNQVWLVTHSDAFLREATGQAGFSVFHMQRPAKQDTTTTTPHNQLAPIAADSELELAVLDLIGDLATYQPNAKVVIFEGEDSEFDRKMTARLFPELEENSNLISAGPRTNAQKLHVLLERAATNGSLRTRFFSIVDRDSDRVDASSVPTHFQWPAYHIENFLLEPRYILRALRDISTTESIFSGEAAVRDALRNAARETMHDHIRHRLQNEANEKLRSALMLRVDRTATDVSSSLSSAIEHTTRRIAALVSSELSAETLATLELAHREQLETALGTDKWMTEYRGRDILKRFVGALGTHLNYVTFRDLVIARMRDDGYRPPGMKSVVDQIL